MNASILTPLASTSSTLKVVEEGWANILFNPKLPLPGSPDVAELKLYSKVAPPKLPVVPCVPTLP